MDRMTALKRVFERASVLFRDHATFDQLATASGVMLYVVGMKIPSEEVNNLFSDLYHLTTRPDLKLVHRREAGEVGDDS